MAAVLLALAAGLSALEAASADPAYFWLSETGVAPAGPEAPAIALTEGESDTLYLWARPSTGERLRNFSVNLIADKSGVDFDESAITVLNSIGGSLERFEYYKDSSTSPAITSLWSESEVTGGQIDGVFDLQGFTVYTHPDIRGIGPGCLASDTNCHLATDGQPAWLVATIGINATTAGTVSLNLQVGDSGMIHDTLSDGDYNFDGEVDADDFLAWESDYGSTTSLNADGDGSGQIDAADYTIWRDNHGGVSTPGTAAGTTVVLGYDTSRDTEPVYDAATDRSITLMHDDPDAVITIAPASPITATPEPSALLLTLLASLAGAARKAR